MSGRESVFLASTNQNESICTVLNGTQEEPENEKSEFPASFLQWMLAEEMEPGPEGIFNSDLLLLWHTWEPGALHLS